MSKKDRLLVHEVVCYLVTLLFSLANMIMGIYSFKIAILALIILFIGLGFKWWGSKTRPNPPDRWDSHLNNEESKWGDT